MRSILNFLEGKGKQQFSSVHFSCSKFAAVLMSQKKAKANSVVAASDEVCFVHFEEQFMDGEE